ncbi:MAG TPA: Fe-S cluster assembly protein SufD [Actinomycetota bacterium]|nr:Fe-S cluster assembly protein SufD [Actinomycetota bacterium]
MGFTRSDVEALSASLNEPGWVLERRLEAWGWFEKMELPGEKEEPWRYTNLARLRFKLDDFSPNARQLTRPVVQSSNGSRGLSPDRSGQGEQIGGTITMTHPDMELDSGGVIITDIHTAIDRHPELVKPHLFAQFNPASHLFSALHGAFFSGGTFIYVPRGRTLSLPVEYGCHIEQPGGSVFPHTVIVVEENSELCYLERFTSSINGGAALSDAAVEVNAGQASRVFVATVQDYSPGVWHFQNHRYRTGRDASFKSLLLTLGGRFSRTEVTTEIQGEGNSVDMMGIYLAGEGQHFDFRTMQDHAAPHSTSDLLYKGALKGNARTVYSGQIHVRPEGRETDAYQTNRNLVLSDHAMANSKPELEIENNDVRCSHAASVGQMDENEVFYLQSRGIDRSSAERLIVKGFLEEVLGKVGRKDITGLVEQLLEERLSE